MARAIPSQGSVRVVRTVLSGLGASFLTAIRGAIQSVPANAASDCPHQRDLDGDGFPTAVDLSRLISVLCEGAADATDPNCPTSRSDFDYDGFPTAVDLSRLIGELFEGGGTVCDPCDPVQETCSE